MAERKIETIGFIGLGVMGEAMCRNLQARGTWRVIAFDLAAAPLERMTALGAQAARTAREVAERADVTITCLPGGAEVRALVLDPGGLVEALSDGRILIDMSTSPPALMREIAGLATARGAHFADAPVARTRQAAIDGTLAIMVGAAPELFDRIRPILAAMGSDITRCGDPGAGQTVKIMNNMVLFQTVLALTEAVTIAQAEGLDPAVLLDTMSKGSGDSFALRNHGLKSILPEVYPERAFSVRYAAKDLAYALEMAAEGGVRADGAATVARAFERAITAGDGDHYFPVIRRTLTEKP